LFSDRVRLEHTSHLLSKLDELLLRHPFLALELSFSD